jgi:hypothetical protein
MTHNHPEHQPVPQEKSFRELLVGAEQTLRAKNVFDKPDTYLKSVKQRYARNSLSHRLLELGIDIEPTDRTLGHNKELPAAKAFHTGCMLGFEIVSAAKERAFLGQLQLSDVVDPSKLADDSQDDVTAEYINAEVILSSAALGLEAASALEPLLEEVEMPAVGDGTMLNYFRSGFGVVMHMFAAALERQRQAEREQRAQSQAAAILGAEGFDFDAGLFKLLNSD